jgi:probable biosynthetic protein (TIGR04098 family)
MIDYLKIFKTIVPSIDNDDIHLPIKDTNIDSLGLLAIRVEIEKSVGFEIPDNEWYSFNCLNDIIVFCNDNARSRIKSKLKLPEHKIHREHFINLPQMANYAISENWLLKEFGDIHWELLSKGLDTESASILDEDGNRLYATFIHIKFNCSSLRLFKENSHIDLSGNMVRYGKNNYLSEIYFNNNKLKINAVLLTSFTKREGSDNLDLIKCHPAVQKNIIPEIDNLPLMLTDYRLLKKGLKDELNLDKVNFDISTNIHFKMVYELNPYYDLNGVGLLYFASYPTISDYCESKYFNNLKNINRWEDEYFTISRDIYYYANCNIDDRIIYHLNSFEFYSKDKVKIQSSLFRESDNTLMTNIFTIKEKYNGRT